MGPLKSFYGENRQALVLAHIRVKKDKALGCDSHLTPICSHHGVFLKDFPPLHHTGMELIKTCLQTDLTSEESPQQLQIGSLTVSHDLLN